MAPIYDGEFEGHKVTITTRENDLKTKVVASVKWKEGQSELSTISGLDERFRTEAEILALLASEGVEVGAQTSEHPIINIW